MTTARIFTYWKNGSTATLYEVDLAGGLTALFSQPIFWNNPEHVSAAYDGNSLLVTSSAHTDPHWPIGLTTRTDLSGTVVNTYDLGASNLSIYSAFMFDSGHVLAFVADLTGSPWHFYAYILDASTGAVLSTTNIDAVYQSWISFPQALSFFGGFAYFYDDAATSSLYKLDLSSGSLSLVGAVSPTELFSSVSSPPSLGAIASYFYDYTTPPQSTAELWSTDLAGNTTLTETLNLPVSPTNSPDHVRFHSLGHDDGSFLWAVTYDNFDFQFFQINENDYSGSSSALFTLTSGANLSTGQFNVNFAFIGGDVVIPSTGGWSIGSLRVG